MRKGNILLLILVVVGIITASVGGYFWWKSTMTSEPFCSKESKICPDGSSVGRKEPNCNFTPCPTLPDPTANWKTYSSNGLFFKYPTEAELTQAERIKNEFNEGGTEINVTYIRPGYNRQQTDISDGYVFGITWGEVIGAGTAKEVSQTKYSQLKDGNVFPELTTPAETKIANRIAYCMEMGPVFYSRTCYVDNGSTVFELSRTSSSNDIKQKQYYDLTLDQILSTFKFL